MNFLKIIGELSLSVGNTNIRIINVISNLLSLIWLGDAVYQFRVLKDWQYGMLRAEEG